MRFFLDACVRAGDLVTALLDLQQDVLLAEDVIPGASDEDILALAFEQDRVLITHVNDFGEPVFRDLLPHKGIVLIDGRVSHRDQTKLMKI